MLLNLRVKLPGMDYAQNPNMIIIYSVDNDIIWMDHCFPCFWHSPNAVDEGEINQLLGFLSNQRFHSVCGRRVMLRNKVENRGCVTAGLSGPDELPHCDALRLFHQFHASPVHGGYPVLQNQALSAPWPETKRHKPRRLHRFQIRRRWDQVLPLLVFSTKCRACHRRNTRSLSTTSQSAISAIPIAAIHNPFGDLDAGLYFVENYLAFCHRCVVAQAKTLILILGDQLSLGLSSLQGRDKATSIILMCEVAAEATYVRHHKKKIAFLFSAMRHFAAELRDLGWAVDYVVLSDPLNTGCFGQEVKRAVARHGAEQVVVTAPGEWRVLDDMQRWSPAPDIIPDNRFIASDAEFAAWADGRKQLRMEYFYRDMRRKTGLLMNGDQPEGGQWNYDHDNRKPAKAAHIFPDMPEFSPDAITRDVLTLVRADFADHFGDLEPFWFAVTRSDAEAALAHFVQHALPKFGDFQDAMLLEEKFLYHSVIGLYLNCGLLDPLETCRAVEAEYRKGRVPINAAEGFIRQIIGWREYVRGIYWLKMPDYAGRNVLGATRALPDFYWTGDTQMACISACVRQTREEAYAHHIQRLMVTGNFALLAGVDPHEVHSWYLAVYADAYEWVEMPNTIGMSQFADGGVLASKPYAASGAYIDRMSNYCKNCFYDVKLKNGPKACPFNYLYWDFLVRHDAKLRGNPRMAQMYRTYDRLSDERKGAIAGDAQQFLERL